MHCNDPPRDWVHESATHHYSKESEFGRRDFFQELHILSAHTSLAEFQQAVSGCWIMEDDLEDFLAYEVSITLRIWTSIGLSIPEEVCQVTGSSITSAVLHGYGKGGRRRIVLS